MSCLTGCGISFAEKESDTGSEEQSTAAVSAVDMDDQSGENLYDSELADETQGSYTLSEYINSGERLILYYMKDHVATGETDRTTLSYPAKDEMCNYILCI
ncbi:MAG: hypothetical protein ACI4JB_03610 [Porcipelethomonas sp.]